MGAVDIDKSKWILLIDGLVRQPFTITYAQLLRLPSKTITAFHECFGSPLAVPTTALWRIGNVKWIGVPLRTLLAYAEPLESAQFVWSEGLDSGIFAGVEADRYQKGLPLRKALCSEVLMAYTMNGKSLGRERGGPVRLVVPGLFGTNSTKWLCRIPLQGSRAPGPYTTHFYNIDNPTTGHMEPVWEVDVNSMITEPAPVVEVKGWAWSCDGIAQVEVSPDRGSSWQHAYVEKKTEMAWQNFEV